MNIFILQASPISRSWTRAADSPDKEHGDDGEDGVNWRRVGTTLVDGGRRRVATLSAADLPVILPRGAFGLRERDVPPPPRKPFIPTTSPTTATTTSLAPSPTTASVATKRTTTYSPRPVSENEVGEEKFQVN